MPKKTEINSLSEPEAHNYPAALSYLSLIYDEQAAIAYVDNLKQAKISEFKAKDIFRASNLSLLGISIRISRKINRKYNLWLKNALHFP